MHAPLCAATKDMVEGCILTLHEYQASAATNIKQASARVALLRCFALHVALPLQHNYFLFSKRLRFFILLCVPGT